MSSSADRNFKHSIPVPRIYKVASKVARNVKQGKGSLKNLVYQEKHVNIKTVYALIVETFKRDNIIEDLIKKSHLLTKEPRFDPWLAKILISELLWGKNKMKGDSKPINTILSYETNLRKLLSECDDTVKSILNHDVSKPRYVRVNTLKIEMEEAVNNFRDDGWTFVPFFDKSDYFGYLERMNKLELHEFMQDLHISNLLVFPPKTEFHRHEGYKSRALILQDKASCLPVHLLNATPGSVVLDMCAAPGMKTTQLSAMIKNSGIVHAVDVDVNREKLLKEFVESAGGTCVKTLLKDVLQVTDDECPDVEYILVDPSCSGSGITDRVEVEDLTDFDKQNRLRKLSNFQAKLLRHATSFPHAKRIVYSTCSLNPEENEEVVRRVLETCKNFKLINARKMLKSWNNLTSEKYPELGDMCIYATPENDKTNGFFIAVLERLQEGEKNPFLNVQLLKMFDNKVKTTKDDKNCEYKTNSLKYAENDEHISDKKFENHNTNFNTTQHHSKSKNKKFVINNNLFKNGNDEEIEEIFTESANEQYFQSESFDRKKKDMHNMNKSNIKCSMKENKMDLELSDRFEEKVKDTKEKLQVQDDTIENNIECKGKRKKKHKKNKTDSESISEYNDETHISCFKGHSAISNETTIPEGAIDNIMGIKIKKKKMIQNKTGLQKNSEPFISQYIEKNSEKRKKERDNKICEDIDNQDIERDSGNFEHEVDHVELHIKKKKKSKRKYIEVENYPDNTTLENTVPVKNNDKSKKFKETTAQDLEDFGQSNIKYSERNKRKSKKKKCNIENENCDVEEQETQLSQNIVIEDKPAKNHIDLAVKKKKKKKQNTELNEFGNTSENADHNKKSKKRKSHCEN